MDIKIYSTSWCSPCRMLTKYLDDRGFTYTKVDVEKNLDEYKEMLRLSNGIESVPQVTIGDKHLVGFNRKYLEDALYH